MSGSSATTRQFYYRHDIYDKMVDEWSMFDSYVDFFVFAASVGYAVTDTPTANSLTEKEIGGTQDDGTRGEMLWMHFTDKPTYRAIAASIAYQHTGNPDALVDPARQLEVLARYARPGADRLDDEFGDAATPPRDGVVDFIEQFYEADSSDSQDTLSEIVGSFDDDMLNLS